MLVLLIAALSVPAVISTEDSFADILVWHSVKMKPGDTYDVSKAKWNTTVYIEKAGDYTIQGASKSVRVLVESGGVNLYLADGLNINCSAHSYTGSRTAAIWVRNAGGTVKLISKKKASITLEGYMCPGIRKEGTDTKLVFETEDPDNPGTINVYSGSQSSNSNDPAALGSMDYSTGNITFNSGNVIARIRGLNSCGAAIGGAEDKNASNITVNGGHVEAYGSEEGTGIGAGAGGVFTGFYVNGGEVYAENKPTALHVAEGAAIGGGINDLDSSDQTPGNIGAKDFYIKGGKVTAISHGPAAAIGGGTNSGCSNINIEGGTVNATCDSKPNNYNCHGAGIGGGYGYQVSTEVNISGGTVTAKGGYSAPGIGSQDSSKDYGGHDKKPDTGIFRISGGTIYTQCGDDARGDIGTRDSKMIITGGNLHALSHAGDAVNGDGDAVHRVEVVFQGVEEDGLAISSLRFKPNDYPYGTDDTLTLAGKFHIWLPKDPNQSFTLASLTRDSQTYRYQGNIPFNSDSGMLGIASHINLIPAQGTKNGEAWGLVGETSLQDMTPPVVDEGYKLDKYYFSDHTPPVANGDGTLLANSPCTDADGKWTYQDSTNLDLTGEVKPIEYSVKFVPNVPRTASTKCSGTMANEPFEYDTSKALTGNGFTLPGYEFKGWNTKPDRSGTHYDNGSYVKNLTSKDGAVVPLYAEWDPLGYSLQLHTYSPFDPTKILTYTQTGLYFDQPAKITTIEEIQKENDAWIFPNYAFHGWRGWNIGSFWEDGADFCNLCIVDGDGTIRGATLFAQWVDDEQIKVTVTKDGAPLSGLTLTGNQAELLLREKDDPQTTYTPFVEEEVLDLASSKIVGTGTYIYKSDPALGEVIPDNTDYYLCFEPNGSHSEYLSDMVEISYGGAASISTIFDYYTASIDEDTSNDGIAGAIISQSEGILIADKELVAPDGAKLTIETTMNDGYHFDGYSLTGVTPGGNFDPSKPVQTITVEGTVDITAHAAPNVYKVHFDANAPSGISGQMEDQDMVYDEPQNLFANKFGRIGGSFKGWNTEKDGSGTWYQDGQSVMKLMTKDGGIFNLYAQWEMTTFHIDYILNGGKLPAGKTNPDSYRADTPTFTLNAPEKKDYNFIGWMGTDLSGPTKKVAIKEGSVGDREYNAVWTMKYYHVYFKENGGTPIEPELVMIHKKAVKPPNPTRDGYRFAGWYRNAGLTKAYDFRQKIEKNTTLYAKWKPLKVPVVMAKGTPSGNRAIKVSWTKVNGAAKYLVYANKCGKNPKLVKKTAKNSYVLKRIKTKRLEAHDCYVLRVAAVDKKGKVIAKSKLFHVITAGTKGEYANVTKIKAEKKSITLKVGQKKKVHATCTLPKGKKHLTKAHGPYLLYTSDNPRVAKVDKKGNVKAIVPGKATIYIQDANGMYCKTIVKVK